MPFRFKNEVAHVDSVVQLELIDLTELPMDLNDGPAIDGFGASIFPLHCTQTMPSNGANVHESNASELQYQVGAAGNNLIAQNGLDSYHI